MAVASYEMALTRLLKDEGGYTDHPSDPGGPTNFGITLNDARRYWKGNATTDDVRALPQSVARRIYRERYWNAMRCDELPAGVDYAVFDYGVNSGIGRAGKVLRRVLKLSDRISVVSDDVIASAGERVASDLVIAICAERIDFLRALKTFPVFGRGWTGRVNGVRAAALAMAQSRPLAPLANVSTEASPGKAVVPVTIPAGPASAGAVIAAGAASAVATSRLEIAALVVAAAAITALAIFLVWRWRHRAHQEAVVAGETPPK
ncbi:secretion activator protein [Afipia massiliensis]|uniref:Secretion activator protein n=1 Tax=Afipia massiliensis TaxID=211460 RepID=A0A4U6BSV2_9BRAD|nr:glycosyl hydrolase 108 family protein [Afipia massiliensis]TKT73667.1 secretion activator protein [Afipia massiliensis]